MNAESFRPVPLRSRECSNGFAESDVAGHGGSDSATTPPTVQQPVATPDVWKGSQGQVKIGFTHDVYVTVPKGIADKMKPVLERKDPLIAPVAQNSPIGTLKMMVDGKPLVELPVVALEQVSQASIFGRAWDSVRLWMQ